MVNFIGSAFITNLIDLQSIIYIFYSVENSIIIFYTNFTEFSAYEIIIINTSSIYMHCKSLDPALAVSFLYTLSLAYLHLL